VFAKSRRRDRLVVDARVAGEHPHLGERFHQPAFLGHVRFRLPELTVVIEVDAPRVGHGRHADAGPLLHELLDELEASVAGKSDVGGHVGGAHRDHPCRAEEGSDPDLEVKRPACGRPEFTGEQGLLFVGEDQRRGWISRVKCSIVSTNAEGEPVSTCPARL
jgi:hypothetical protein